MQKATSGSKVRPTLRPGRTKQRQIASHAPIRGWAAPLQRQPAAGSLLAIATILGFLLHFAGDVSQTNYLTQLGLEPTSFPQPVDAKVINGVYVVVSEGSELFKDVPWPKVATLLLLATGFLVITGAQQSLTQG
ncbi:hypothetical protein RKE57_06130 [Stenotrophomonas geniculata]|uniref:hypothetical protein n=1 Tax=Stenotrophomonas geniculata TaxID=86188 RepID=UPI00287F98C5|nr:hypothetical protein [Stenotrophomonas geniculata]WNF11714.1 hypothetical protein RKE57_06130 [Stenotrophomonas geniculata]